MVSIFLLFSRAKCPTHGFVMLINQWHKFRALHDIQKYKVEFYFGRKWVIWEVNPTERDENESNKTYKHER